jgi:hypothetical protein
MPIFEECVQRGTRALQPLAIDVTEGTLYFVTDENITERSNGSVWQNNSPTGTLSGTIAQQPTGLGPAHAGLLFQVLAPYFHTCRWNGTAWEFAPGDCGNGYLTERVVAPQAGEGLALCNGAATDYLKVGGTSLTVQAFTTPNAVGAYLKGAAAYTGAVNPAVGGTTGAAAGTTALDGPTVTGAADRALSANLGGATATGACDRILSATTSAQPEYYTAGAGGHGHTGWVDAGGNHTHGVAIGDTGGASSSRGADAGSSYNSTDQYHTHNIGNRTTDDGGWHGHTMGVNGVGDHSHWVGAHSHTVTAPDHLHGLAQHTHTVTDHLHGIAQHTHGLNAPTHTTPASEPANLGVLVYFRR